ncbi:MAG: hypothetical protein ACJAS1_004456 [Oleiphilaceae bacterium]|jgi:hypothetical protein
MTDFKVNNNNQASVNAFILYSTSACHLCDEALLILNDLHDQMLELAKEQSFSVQNQSIYTVELVDVAEDLALIEIYGPSIPVLNFASSSEELAWPFDIQSAYQFIAPKLVFPTQKN